MLTSDVTDTVANVTDSDDDDDDDDDDSTPDVSEATLADVMAQETSYPSGVRVVHSEDVQLGPRLNYNAPVVINQYVTSRGICDRQWKQLALNAPGQGWAGDDVSCIQESEHGLPEKPHFFTSLASARHRCTIWIVTLSVAVTVTLATLLVVNANRHAAVNPATSNPYAGEGTFNQPNTKYNVTLSGKLRMLNRTDWLAQPATAPLDLLARPAQLVVISHTATENCYSQAQCIYFVRNMQTFHIESKGWFDIGYNFLIGGDGYVYVGRGWDTMGAHTYGYNVCSIGISFIGTYLTTQPTDGQILAAELLIEQGVLLGKLIPDYQLVGHRQVSATESPGQALFDILKKLPHWTKIPDKCVKKSQ